MVKNAHCSVSFYVGHASIPLLTNDVDTHDLDDEDGHVNTCWPLSPTDLAEVMKIRNTHCVVPVPLFDITGHCLVPSQANVALEGATVFVRFTLSSLTTPFGTIAGCVPERIITL